VQGAGEGGGAVLSWHYCRLQAHAMSEQHLRRYDPGGLCCTARQVLSYFKSYLAMVRVIV
jgi:hypothetical protein